MHENGEADVRFEVAISDGLAVRIVHSPSPVFWTFWRPSCARMWRNMLDCTFEYTNWANGTRCRCQTYEGGFGGVPNAEAHGGYTFCAVATLHLLDRFDVMDCQMVKVGGTRI